MMKQLTSNPSPASERLGWQLFALMVQCFPPDPLVENYVANFLRGGPLSATFYLRLGYAARRREPRSRAPLDSELPGMLSAVEDMHRGEEIEAMDELPPPLPTSPSRLGTSFSGKI